MMRDKELEELVIKLGVFGRADVGQIESDYFLREALENAKEQGLVDLDETSGVSEEEWALRVHELRMAGLEQERTERIDRKLDNEQRRLEMTEQAKEKNELEFMDLRSTNIIRVDGVAIRFSKYVKWHKDIKGQVEKSFLNIEIVGKNKSIKLLSGAKDSNVWCAIKNVVEPAQMELELNV